MPRISNLLMRKDLTPFEQQLCKKQATLKNGIINIENIHLNASMMSASTTGMDSNRFPLRSARRADFAQQDQNLSEYKANFSDFSKSPKNANASKHS